jgi:hypothetical protein
MAVIGIQTDGDDAAEKSRDLGIKAQGRQVGQMLSARLQGGQSQCSKPVHESSSRENSGPLRGPPLSLIKGRTKRKCRRFRAGIPNVIEA